MATYCTLEDLLRAVPRRTLAQLTCDTPPATEPDEGVVSWAIQSAAELIDGYLRQRYTLPMRDVPTMVRDVSVAIARHTLYARRPEGKEDLPPAVVRTYKDAIKLLSDIAKGNVDLGTTDSGSGSSGGGTVPEPTPDGSVKCATAPRLFPRDVLDQY